MRVSVIGTGFGSRVVAKIFEEIGAEVVHVVSARDEEAVRRACAADVDLVSIHSPPFLHLPHVKIALEHGRDILCDKPFGRSAVESSEMLIAARQAGVLHMINFEFRHEPIRAKVKELFDAGAIGALRHIFWPTFSSVGRKWPHHWFFDRELGGGFVGAFMSHSIDFIRWLNGDIVDATGICRTEVPFRADREGVMQRCTAEDSFTASLIFADGATVTIDTAYSPAASVHNLPIVIFGSEGVAEIHGMTDLYVRRSKTDVDHFQFPLHQGDPHWPAMTSWAMDVRAAVQDRRQISPSFADGLATAEVMDMFRRKAIWIAENGSQR